MNEQEKKQALHNAIDTYNCRVEAAKHIPHNSFSAWGNDKCIARTADTIQAMRHGTASVRQYRYWLTH